MNRRKRQLCLALMLLLLPALAPSPALRYGGGAVTAYGVCTALAAAAGVWLFERLRVRRVIGTKRKDGPIAVLFRVDALELALWCIPAALAGARALYVLLRPGYYLFDAGIGHAFALWEGGFLLYGAAAGAMLAAAQLAKKKGESPAALLDDMAAPGLLAIALCRLAEPLAGEGLGPWMENPELCRFPLAVQNGFGEWQLAVFLFEALAALAIMAAVLGVRAGAGRRLRTALAMYSAAQIVLESLRMDGVLRIGFVRVSQALAALVLLALSAGARRGNRRAAMRRGALVILGSVAIGGIEWALDKTQTPNLLLYAAMALVCAGLAANALGADKRIIHTDKKEKR